MRRGYFIPHGCVTDPKYYVFDVKIGRFRSSLDFTHSLYIGFRPMLIGERACTYAAGILIFVSATPTTMDLTLIFYHLQLFRISALDNYGFDTNILPFTIIFT